MCVSEFGSRGQHVQALFVNRQAQHLRCLQQKEPFPAEMEERVATWAAAEAMGEMLDDGGMSTKSGGARLTPIPYVVRFPSSVETRTKPAIEPSMAFASAQRSLRRVLIGTRRRAAI